MSPNVNMHARSAAALAVVLMLSACGTARINNDGAAVRDQSNSSVQRNLRIVPLDTSEVTPGGAAFADARAAAAQSAQVSSCAKSGRTVEQHMQPCASPPTPKRSSSEARFAR